MADLMKYLSSKNVWKSALTEPFNVQFCDRSACQCSSVLVQTVFFQIWLQEAVWRFAATLFAESAFLW